MDSTIRLRQMNQPELSGFVIPIVQAYLAGTGNYTGIFYPRYQNPQGYLVSGAFISQTDLDSAISQALVYVSNTYYPENNPSGYVTGVNTGAFISTGQTGSFGNFAGVVYTTGNQYVSGGKVFVNDLTFQSNLLGRGSNNSFGYYDTGIHVYYKIVDFVDFSSLGTARINGVGYSYNTDNISCDWNNRILYSSLITPSVDWDSRTLYGNWSSTSFINTGQTGIFITTGMTGLFASSAETVFTTGNQSIAGQKTFSNSVILSDGRLDSSFSDGFSKSIRLMPSGGSVVVGTDTVLARGYPMLVHVGTNANLQIRPSAYGFSNGVLIQSSNDNNTSVVPMELSASKFSLNSFGGKIVFDNGNVGLNNSSPQYLLDVNGIIGNSSGTFPSTQIRIGEGYILDNSGNATIDWINRVLLNSLGNTTIDWQKNILSGNWKSSSFISTGQTGAFYPYNSNPLNYLSEIQTGKVQLIADGSILLMPGQQPILDAGGSIILDAAGNYLTQPTFGYLGVNQGNPQYTVDVFGSGNFSNGVFWNGNPVVTGGPYITNTTGLNSLSGNLAYPLIIVSGGFNVASGNSIVLVNSLISTSTGTFPNASGLAGAKFTIKDWKGNASGYSITITGVNNQTFDGTLSKTISTAYASMTIVSDGQNWSVI